MRAVRDRSLTVKAACAAFGVSETCYRYRAKGSVENELIADWLVRLAHIQMTSSSLNLRHKQAE